MKTLDEILGELAGSASLCWNPKPGDQVFDSTQAAKFVAEAKSLIESTYGQQRAKQVQDALLPYAFHKADCLQLDSDHIRALKADCSCGFLEALKRGESK